MATNTVKRTRNYACVVYPDTAPINWQDLLQDEFIPSFISPLHDSDKNPTGELKKPHYHVLIMFDNVKTCEQAKAVFNKIGGVGCEVVNSIRGYSRYLCHLDNPEKWQYNTSSVRCLCGADYFNTIGLAIDKYVAISEMIDFCNDNDITNYSYFLTYCRHSNYSWFRVLCDSGTFVIKEFLKNRKSLDN